jgi:hypothetical protein
MTHITTHSPAGIVARISARVRRHQRDLSDRMHAAGDERAQQHGWEITKSTGRLGFGTRTYRDARFDDRRQQISSTAAQVTGPKADGYQNEASNHQPGSDVGE